MPTWRVLSCCVVSVASSFTLAVYVWASERESERAREGREGTYLDALLVVALHLAPVLELEALGPVLLVQVEEHALLELRLAIRDRDRVVVAVQAVDQGLDRRLLQVPDVGRRLARLDAHHDLLRVDGPERVDDDLALDRLDRVDDDGDRAGVQLLEGLRREGGKVRVSRCERGKESAAGGERDAPAAC